MLLELFLGFLKVGCFAFGGAYGAIPLIRDVVLSYGWMGEEELTYLIAVSESTPGPIMVNLATYVGSSQAGFWGAAAATLAVVFPSFFIILLLTALLKTAVKNKYIQAVLTGVKPCIAGIILATGAYMTASVCFLSFPGIRPDIRNLVIVLLLIAAMAIWKKWFQKRLPPLQLILLSACFGVVIYGIF